VAWGRDLFLDAFLLEICIAGLARHLDVGVYTVKTIYFHGSFRVGYETGCKAFISRMRLVHNFVYSVINSGNFGKKLLLNQIHI